MVYIGIVGFILLFIYDINQILFKQKILKVCFTLGTLLILFSTIIAIFNPIVNIIGIIISVLALCYTIYALFFALDFNNTYVKDEFKIVDTGLYALCRHPGFYGLLGIYIGLYLGYQTNELLDMLIVYNLLNFLYILLEDRIIFMRLFSNYDDYKKEVPFLIPNKNSINKFINDRG